MDTKSYHDEPSVFSQVGQLKEQIRQLQRERDQAHEMLNGIKKFGNRISFWDGAPSRLSHLVEHIRASFGCQIVSLALFETGTLHHCAITPADAQLDIAIPTHDLEKAVIENAPQALPDGDRHLLVIPLITGMQRVGVLQILTSFSLPTEWASFWKAFGARIASLIVGGQLLEQLEQARTRHQLLYQLTGQLISGINIDKMASDVLSLTRPYVEATDGCMFLLNEQGQTMSHIPAYETVADEQHIQDILEKGLVQWAIDHKEPALVVDTSMDERWTHLPEESPHIRSAVAVPLLHGSQLRGVLVLMHTQPSHFTPDHLSFLSAVADQAAIAIENAFLFEQTQQRMIQMGAINEISQAASTLHLDDVLQIVTKCIAEALDIRRCAIFLLDDTGTQLILSAVSEPQMAKHKASFQIPLSDRPHIAEAIYVRQPVQIADVMADERLDAFWGEARKLDIRSQLSVPLISRQRVIGAIGIDRSPLQPLFSKSEIELCQTIAHQAANAIENARLYEEVQHRAERLSLVNLVSYDIGSILDVNQLLWEVVRLIQEAFDCYHVAIGLIEGENLVFRAEITEQRQFDSEIRLNWKTETSISCWAARHGRSLLVPDVSQDTRYLAISHIDDTGSELAVPLKVPARSGQNIESGNLIIGVLNVESNQTNAFSVDDQQLLEALAAQVAVAIENARLFTSLREERATLEALVNGTDDAIIITDTAARILFFNPAARQAFLEGDTVAPGQLFVDLVRNETLLAVWRETTGSHSTEIPLADGRTFYANIARIQDVGTVIVTQDITHLKEMDQIKSNFVSTVSHDLRSPLQVIQTSAELLPKLGELNREQHKEVEHILAVVRRISNLVQHLLDIGRIEAGVGMEVVPCAIDEVIARAAGTLRPLAEQKGLEFSIELPKALPLLQGNPLRLEQVIGNLASNAIKFTFAGSVTISAWAEADKVIIEVQDTGVGIPQEAQEKLFEKFYRVKTSETQGIEGTGLGLAIVKSIVESYNGQITVQSSPRLGSTFTVELPLHEPPPQQEPPIP